MESFSVQTTKLLDDVQCKQMVNKSKSIKNQHNTATLVNKRVCLLVLASIQSSPSRCSYKCSHIRLIDVSNTVHIRLNPNVSFGTKELSPIFLSGTSWVKYSLLILVQNFITNVIVHVRSFRRNCRNPSQKIKC